MELSSGVHQIDGVGGANSFLVISDQGVAVIDTGLPGNEKKIVEYARNRRSSPARLSYIVLTHPDLDHSGSAAKLKDLTGAKVAIHQADALRLSGEKKLKEVKGPMGLLFGVMGPFMRFTPVNPTSCSRTPTGCSTLRSSTPPDTPKGASPSTRTRRPSSSGMRSGPTLPASPSCLLARSPSTWTRPRSRSRRSPRFSMPSSSQGTAPRSRRTHRLPSPVSSKRGSPVMVASTARATVAVCAGPLALALAGPFLELGQRELLSDEVLVLLPLDALDANVPGHGRPHRRHRHG